MQHTYGDRRKSSSINPLRTLKVTTGSATPEIMHHWLGGGGGGGQDSKVFKNLAIFLKAGQEILKH